MFFMIFASFLVTINSVVHNSSNNCLTDIWHFTPPCSQMTTLNSFSYYNSQYHICYHHKPYRKQNESLHCGHAVSDDLVRWKQWRDAPGADRPCDLVACQPDDDDAAADNDVVSPVHKSWLMQNMAVDTNIVSFEIDWNISFLRQKDTQAIFCDPKVWRYRTSWYAVLTDSHEGRGRALLYRSDDLRRWRRVAVLAAGRRGSLWKRAEFFELDRRFVLLKTARDIRSNGDDQTEYLIGSFDYSSYEFVPSTVGFNALDTGFDFSAARTTEAADGRRVLVAHVGASLSMARELRVSGESLLMEPLREYRSLRGELVFAGRAAPGAVIALAGGAAEVLAHAELRGAGRALLRLELGGTRALIVWYDAAAQEVVVRRTGTAGGERRAAARHVGARLAYRLFVDVGSVEVFCGAGGSIFSSRVFPTTLSRLRVPHHSMPFRLRIFKTQRTVPQF